MIHFRKFVVTGMAALALTLTAQPIAPVIAQAPKPPTDARKVVQPTKNGTFKLDAGDDPYGFEQAATSARDFDLSVSFVNPSLSDYLVGVDFRSSGPHFYALGLTSEGNALMFISRAYDQFVPLKDKTFMPSWKKNVGEKNDVALYVRGGQALLFVNKVFVDSYDVSEFNDFGDLRIFGYGAKEQSSTLDYKQFTVKVPANAIPPSTSAKGPINKSIVLSMYRSGYSQWGRSAGMTEPRAGCSSFNDGSPVLQFQAVMKVTNNGKTPMKRWAPLAVTRGNKLAYLCVLGYTAWPLVQPGASADITIEYYIEKGDAIAYLFVIDLDNGRSDKLPAPAP